MKMNMIMDYEFAKENFLLLLEHIEAYDFKYLTYQEIENETGIDSNIVKKYVIDPLVKERKIELNKEVIANRWAYSYRLLKEKPVAIESQPTNDNKIEIIDERVVLNKEFRIYGTKENPLFLAKDVAEWIDYSKDSKGNYNVSAMLSNVDEEEKTKIFMNLNNSKVGSNTWFLTENGLYEVLMQSRKPIAKEFKKEVKKILKQIRQTGGYIPVKQGDSEVEVLAKAFNIINKTNIMLENEVKALKGKLDGRDKSVTLTDGVKLLGIKGLNSTIFNISGLIPLFFYVLRGKLRINREKIFFNKIYTKEKLFMIKLKTGTFKYAQLCEMMDWEKKSGKGKILQIESLSNHCDWEKGEKATFIIHRVYEEPVEKIREKAGKYVDVVEDVLLSIIHNRALQGNDDIVYYGVNELMTLATLISEEYSISYSNKDYLFATEGITINRNIIRYYHNNYYSVLRGALNSGLKRMNDKRYIKSSEVTMIKDNKSKEREITDKEAKILLEAEAFIMKEMGYSSLNKIVLVGKYFEFKNRVIKKINSEDNELKLINYRKAFKIIYTKNTIKWGIEDKLSDNKTRELFEVTHRGIVDLARKHFEKNHDIARMKVICKQAKDNLGFGEAFITETELGIEDKRVDIAFSYPSFIEDIDLIDRILRCK